MFEKIMTDYNEAIIDTDRDKAVKVIHDSIRAGVSAEEVVFKIIIPSLEQMCNLNYKKGKYEILNLAQIFMASQIALEVTEDMIARFKKVPGKTGSVVIGTSYGDFHGLGKRIVTGCLKANMIEVIDLGLNVSANRFVEEAMTNNSQVIAISSMMMHTATGENGCIGVRKILADKNLENKIKVIVGGAPYRYDPELYKSVRADAWSDSAIDSVNVITGLIREVLN